MVMFFLCHALFVARSDMNNLCIAFQYLNLSGSGSVLLKCKSEKNFVAGSRSAGPYLRFVTTGVDVLFSSQCPILPFWHREREILAYFGTSRVLAFFGVLLQGQIMRWCPKIDKYQVFARPTLLSLFLCYD